jgi:hypothetical protein
MKILLLRYYRIIKKKLNYKGSCIFISRAAGRRRTQSKPLEGNDTTSGLLAINKKESSLIALSRPTAAPASKKDHYEAR